MKRTPVRPSCPWCGKTRSVFRGRCRVCRTLIPSVCLRTPKHERFKLPFMEAYSNYGAGTENGKPRLSNIVRRQRIVVF